MSTVFPVPLKAVFPNQSSDFAEFKSLLQRLNRAEALISSAMLNMVISDPVNRRANLLEQEKLIRHIFTKTQIERIENYARQNGGAHRVCVFHRGQVLELIRWICLYSDHGPGTGSTFEKWKPRQVFAKVALMAGELWHDRVYAKLEARPGRKPLSRENTLGPLRHAASETSSPWDPLRTLGRGKAFFREHYSSFLPDFGARFLHRTGLSIEEYYTCLTMIMSHHACGSYALNLNMKLDPPPIIKEPFLRFVALESQTPDELEYSLWKGNKSASPGEDRVYDQKPLRERPILRVKDSIAAMDPVFIAEKASVGPLFHILYKGMQKEEVSSIFSAFGKAFESYAQTLLERMYPAEADGLPPKVVRNPLGLTSKGTQVEVSDASLDFLSDLVLFEMKARWIQENKVVDDKHDDFLEYLRLLYSNEKKGVQLANAINRLIDGTWTTKTFDLKTAKRVFPILLVHDHLLNVVGYPWFLATEFAKALEAPQPPQSAYMKKGQLLIAPLTVMSIDLLEDLEASVKSIYLPNLLHDYVVTIHNSRRQLNGVSLSDFILRSKYASKMIREGSVKAEAMKVLEESSIIAKADGANWLAEP